jgi:D-alanyl-D-alanine dipeptidase
MKLQFSGGLEKIEGDNKAPAGIFEIPTAFGFAPKTDRIKMPYHQITENTECVDDPQSDQYNCLVERRATDSWTSSEKLTEQPVLYKWGLVINHNFPSPASGKGSCVFMHIWREAGRGTAGCTAMAEVDLLRIIEWLAPEKHPRLVQMPAEEYDRLAPELGLPQV